MKRNKRAFTIVELVIVVAVIGVLAAILIPTFVNLTNKAKKEADNHLVSNLNTALAMAEGDQGSKNKTMHDAVLDLHEYGFELDKIVSMSEYDLLWDQNTNRFLLNSEKNVGVNYWHIERSMPSTQKYSIYAGEKWTLKEIGGLKVGFDSGYHDDLKSVEYVGIGSKQTVTLRTYGENVTVNAPLDTVNHYAVAKTLTITAVGPTDCYHEYGTVGKATISSGKLIVEDTGFIADLNGESEATVEVQGVVMAATGDAATHITGNGNYPSHSSDILDVENFDELQGMAYACNLGTTFEGKTIRLLNDIDMKNKVWVPFGVRYERKVNGGDKYSMLNLKDSRLFMGNIDGNGHKILNLSNKGYKTEARHNSTSGTIGATYGLIGFGTGSIKVSNLTISYDIVAEGEQATNCVGVIGFYYNQEVNPILKHVKDAEGEGWHDEYDAQRYFPEQHKYIVKHATVEFDNVDVSGSIVGEDGISGYIGCTYGGQDQYMFDDNAIYYYSNSGNVYSGNGISKKAGSQETWEAIALSENGSGWYAKNLYSGSNQTNASNYVQFYDGDEAQTCSSTEKCITFAPIFVNFKFTNCDSTLTTTAMSRAGIFFGKFSSGADTSKQFEVHFDNCTNTGNVYSKHASRTDFAGIIAGFFGGTFIIKNADLFTSGVTNTGTIYYCFETVNAGSRTGSDALLPA